MAFGRPQLNDPKDTIINSTSKDLMEATLEVGDIY